MKKRVLIVDDDKMVRDLFKAFFKEEFETFYADSVKSFDSLTKKYPYDLIIMDIFLNDKKNGIELTKELRQNEFYKKTPIIIMSAFSPAAILSEAMEAGATSFIGKPADFKKIKEYILNLV